MVRARDREDAERLARKLDLDGPVIETPERDYRYRLFVPRHSWGLYLYGTGADIEYGNFKAAVEERHGISRELLYSRVWSVMLSLQPRLWPKLRKQLMPRSRSPWADDPLFDGLDAYGNEPPFDDLDLDTYAEPVFDRGPAVPLPDESWDDPPRKRRRARRRRR